MGDRDGAPAGRRWPRPAIAELRERVDRAASLLDEVGDVYHLADLLASAAYGALCMGSDRDAKEFVDRAIPIARELDNPYVLDAPPAATSGSPRC